MASFALVSPEQMPIHVLFPDQYEASKRTIALDFLFFGTAITLAVVVAAVVNLRLA
jgi:hypothetical protein